MKVAEAAAKTAKEILRSGSKKRLSGTTLEVGKVGGGLDDSFDFSAVGTGMDFKVRGIVDEGMDVEGWDRELHDIEECRARAKGIREEREKRHNRKASC